LFVPPIYRATDAGQVHRVIRQHPLALLVSNGPRTPYTTQLPVVHAAEDDDSESFSGFSLLGHLNRANPHWAALSGGGPATLLFVGPNSYVTPALYDTPVAAPTWNFVTVELAGDLTPLAGTEQTLEVVRRTAGLFEKRFGRGWEPDGSLDYFRSIVSGVGAFRFQVTAGQAMFKLSQEKEPQIRDRVAASMLADSDVRCHELGVHMQQTGGAR
jgi:predicted FMN-binding regulatory protein PaiB